MIVHCLCPPSPLLRAQPRPVPFYILALAGSTSRARKLFVNFRCNCQKNTHIIQSSIRSIWALKAPYGILIPRHNSIIYTSIDVMMRLVWFAPEMKENRQKKNSQLPPLQAQRRGAIYWLLVVHTHIFARVHSQTANAFHWQQQQRDDCAASRTHKPMHNKGLPQRCVCVLCAHGQTTVVLQGGGGILCFASNNTIYVWYITARASSITSGDFGNVHNMVAHKSFAFILYISYLYTFSRRFDYYESLSCWGVRERERLVCPCRC